MAVSKWILEADCFAWILDLSFTRYVCGEGTGSPLQYSCLGNPMDGGAWWAADYGVAKSRTRFSDFTFTFHVHALEKEMAIHSSFLACRIPGTGEPVGLPSMGSHRVGHDLSDLAAAAAADMHDAGQVIETFCASSLFANLDLYQQFSHWTLVKIKWASICKF